ncbi:hypothetical protein BH11PLA1_BH11PLA1_02880 [soil metagenome]
MMNAHRTVSKVAAGALAAACAVALSAPTSALAQRAGMPIAPTNVPVPRAGFPTSPGPITPNRVTITPPRPDITPTRAALPGPSYVRPPERFILRPTHNNNNNNNNNGSTPLTRLRGANIGVGEAVIGLERARDRTVRTTTTDRNGDGMADRRNGPNGVNGALSPGGSFVNGSFNSGNFSGSFTLNSGFGFGAYRGLGGYGTGSGTFFGGGGIGDRDDDFNGGDQNGRHHHHRHNFPTYPFSPYGFGYGYGLGYGYGYGNYYSTPLWYGTLQTIDPQLNVTDPNATATAANTAANGTAGNGSAGNGSAANPPVTPPTAQARAIALLRDGEFAKASNALREHLEKAPRDVAALRTLGLALIGARKSSDGAAMVMMAYETDPTLAYRSPSVEFGTDKRGKEQMERVAQAALSFAQRQGTASSWLSATVALQGVDRNDAAKKQLRRAEENGLEARVADELRKALR